MSGIDQCPPPPSPQIEVRYVKDQCIEPRGLYGSKTQFGQAQISEDRRPEAERMRASQRTFEPFRSDPKFEQQAVMPPPTNMPAPVVWMVPYQPPANTEEETSEEKGKNKAPPKRFSYNPVSDIPTTADGTPLQLDEDARDIRTYPQDGRYFRLVQGRWIQEQTPGQISGSFKERVLANVQSKPRQTGRAMLQETRRAFSQAHKQNGTEISKEIADTSKGMERYRATVRKLVKLMLEENQRSTKLDRRDARRGAQEAQEVPLFSQTTSFDYEGSLEEAFAPHQQIDPEELFYETEAREAEIAEDLKAHAALLESKAKYDNWFLKVRKDKIHSRELPPEPIERDEVQEVLNAETEARYKDWYVKLDKDTEHEIRNR